MAQANHPPVAIIMGSDSDWPVMQAAGNALDELGVAYKASIVSAHRTPEEMAAFATSARERGIRVIIAGAGGAAHLPGMVAAQTSLPVIGVPVPLGHMHGLDALASIVQMPNGVPVATVAIGGAYNAGLLAAQVLASGEGEAARELASKLDQYKRDMRQRVLNKSLEQ